MDNATENTAANRAVFREGGTLDPNVTAAAPREWPARGRWSPTPTGAWRARRARCSRARPGGAASPTWSAAWPTGAAAGASAGRRPPRPTSSRPPRRSRPPTPTSRTGTAGGCGPTTSRGRVNPEVRRRARVATALPSAESPVRLVGAVRLDQDDAWQDPARLIDPRRLREGYESPELRGATGDRAKRFLTVVEGAFSDDLRKVA